MKMYSRGSRGRTRNAIGLQGRVGSNPTIFAIKVIALTERLFLSKTEIKKYKMYKKIQITIKTFLKSVTNCIDKLVITS